MNNAKKDLKVPYLSASKMEKLLKLVSERSLKNITADYFKSYGFGQADAYLAMNTLRFLGLINENGETTDLLRKFQLSGNTRNEEIQKILRESYKSLFERIGNPYDLPKDELTDEFVGCYSLSRRIAGSAVPAFLKLCEFSGLVEQGSVLTRKRTSTQNKKRLSVQKAEANGSTGAYDGFIAISIADGKTEWKLPAKTLAKMAFGGELADDIKAITDQLSKFAEKHLIEKHEEGEEE